MVSPARHITRCLAAGVVALLPLGGTVYAILWVERAIAASWLAERAFYFPGLGIVLALLALYAVGLFVTSVLGRWIWRRTDRLIERLPLMGAMYQSLKEILGYDSGRERFFRGVVAVQCDEGIELGLVTGETTGPEGQPRALVFVPGSPNPGNGRLLLLEPHTMRKLDVKVADALRALVSMGKAPLQGST
jgi:uncharacterized membrane protein